MSSTRRPIYVLNEPMILTFVITRDLGIARSKIQEVLNDGNCRSSGLVFGRFDYVFEIESESVETGFEILNKIRENILQPPRSQIPETSLLSLLCFPVRRTGEKRRRERTDFPYTAYCVFRVVRRRKRARKRKNVDALDDATEGVLNVLDSIRKKCRQASFELFWNPSLVSYVLSLKGNDFDQITKQLTVLRRRTLSIRDFCTFVTVSESSAEQTVKPIRVTASVNVKLGDSRLLTQMLEMPNSFYRLGYFDVTRDVTADSIEGLLKEIAETRKLFKKRGPPNWTGTVLKFESSKILGETA